MDKDPYRVFIDLYPMSIDVNSGEMDPYTSCMDLYRSDLDLKWVNMEL